MNYVTVYYINHIMCTYVYIYIYGKEQFHIRYIFLI
jgi:hypothetical protein